MTSIAEKIDAAVIMTKCTTLFGEEWKDIDSKYNLNRNLTGSCKVDFDYAYAYGADSRDDLRLGILRNLNFETITHFNENSYGPIGGKKELISAFKNGEIKNKMQTVYLPFDTSLPTWKHLGFIRTRILGKFGTEKRRPLTTRNGEEAVVCGWGIPFANGIPTERDERPGTAFEVSMSFPKSYKEELNEQILSNPLSVSSAVKEIFPHHFKALERALAYNGSSSIEGLPVYLIDDINIKIDQAPLKQLGETYPREIITATMRRYSDPSEKINLEAII